MEKNSLGINMKKIILTVFAVLLIGCINCLPVYIKYFLPPKVQKLHSLTHQDINMVYTMLKRYTGDPARIPPLIILDKEKIKVGEYADGTPIYAYPDDINAFALSDKDGNPIAIVITQALINYLNTLDEVAAVLGHEMGHIILRHAYYDDDQKEKEAAADKFAIYVMLRANFNICQAANLFKYLRWDEGDNLNTTDHPDFSFRIWEMTFPQCGGTT